MGKVHVVGTLWELFRSLKVCGYSSVDVGPLLGGSSGGPYVDRAAMDEALSPVTAMMVLVREAGANVEVCVHDGSEVIATLPTT
jgi:hypothetical protein